MIHDLLLFAFGIIYSFWKIFLLMFPFINHAIHNDIAASIFGGIIGSVVAYGLVIYRSKTYFQPSREK